MHQPSGSGRNVEDAPPHRDLLQMSYGKDTGSDLSISIWLFPSLLPTESVQGNSLTQGLAATRKLASKPASMPVLQRTLTSSLEISTAPKPHWENPGNNREYPENNISLSHTERPVPSSGGVACSEKEILLLPHKAILPGAQGILCKDQAPARL